MMLRLLLLAAGTVAGAVGGYLARHYLGGGYPCVPEAWPALQRLPRPRRHSPPTPNLPTSDGHRDSE
ncbi:MAG: hypothetical protein JNM56_04460 [Planctomycetia bacterium]|nr:hypothetical protein [Planctomycetia bacterium]